jgi:hypothetical protein
MPGSERPFVRVPRWLQLVLGLVGEGAPIAWIDERQKRSAGEHLSGITYG